MFVLFLLAQFTWFKKKTADVWFRSRRADTDNYYWLYTNEA